VGGIECSWPVTRPTRTNRSDRLRPGGASQVYDRHVHRREISIGFLLRLLGGGRQNTQTEPQPNAADAATSASASAVPVGPAAIPTAPQRRAPGLGGPAACPYCATLLDPAPERGRLCPRCRRPIVVRRVDGRLVLLTNEALDVFDAERDRESKESIWTGERRRWLALAKGVSAPVNQIARLGAVPPSEAAVSASKDLYLAAAERAVRTARRDKRWDKVARIRHAQAASLYRASGSAIPPPDEVVDLHRAWSAAAMRSLVGFGAQVELVAAGCCAICGSDNGKAFRIAAELRSQRLPHAGCPKGLCPCDWWPLPDAKATGRRTRRRPAPPAG
jgi:hypothetical protein